MCHEVFYLNQRTGEKVYNWKQAAKWVVVGDRVLQFVISKSVSNSGSNGRANKLPI